MTNIPEEGKIEEELQQGVHTRSQGSVNTGQEMIPEIFYVKENLI